MDTATLVGWLERPERAASWLRSLGLRDPSRGCANLVGLADSGLTLDLLLALCGQLARHMPGLSDPDMALNNLDRFVASARNPLALAALFERDPDALPPLLQIFSTSQHLSDLLIRDPESYDLLRLTEGRPVARNVLVEEVCSEAAAAGDVQAVLSVLRRYKNREMLRIAYGDLIQRQPLATVAEQLSFLADALCEAAQRAARREWEARRGAPRLADGRPARFVILALGKLGGVELNYSSDIDLMFLSEGPGETDGPRRISNQEFFDRVAQLIVRLLSEPTELGAPYRVDLRLRPEGRQGPVVNTIDAALHYYDTSGRTWERQAMIKARPVAGDLDLGARFLNQLQPWIYQRFLSRADITGIKALKRRIERRAAEEGEAATNVKRGRGGIRDIEFVIQFLQLLNGGDLPEIRTGNTLQAIARLEQAGCLTFHERSFLEEHYEFLRKIEHRLQIMFDLQTHTLPEDEDELRRLAIRMGYVDSPPGAALAAFRNDYQQKTERNRRILNHLLHDAFGERDEADPEADLVLDPEPSEAFIRRRLAPYGFRDVPAAYRNLMALSVERIPFLSTRRCRHFLAAIASRLLQAVAATPDPDATLVTLSEVSDSLGGKGVLWELFNQHPPSLELYVRLCASSPYLAGILISNPGMIDELLDSLMLDKLPTLEALEAALDGLCRGAEDPEPILHSFKCAQHLRIGVRDILGKEDIKATHRALSDVAEVCLRQIARREQERLLQRYGQPTVQQGERAGRPCELVILALGKLGGREPNYHSDLDVMFLYEAEGRTAPAPGVRRPDITTNQHVFSQLGQRIIKTVTRLGPHGRLYELDARLRPTGRSGALAVSLDELTRYFAEGRGQLWERQALCKARPVFGSPEARQRAMDAVRQAVTARPWRPEHAEQIRRMRFRLEQTARPQNLKRGRGGTMDVEFIAQMLQLRHAAARPELLTPGTLDALDALGRAGVLSPPDAALLQESYRFLRRVESRLRLMNTAARHDLPQDSLEQKKLAYLLDYPDARRLLADCDRYRRENRRLFQRLFDQAAAQTTLAGG